MPRRRIELTTSKPAPLQADVVTAGPGSGPGLVLCTGMDGGTAAVQQAAELFAQEGYVVIVPLPACAPDTHDLAACVTALESLAQCKGGIGAVAYGAGAAAALQVAAQGLLKCLVCYEPQGVEARQLEDIAVPLLVHPAGGTTGAPPSAGIAHSRTLALLRGAIGPHYDLSALWDQHRDCEFVTRDADATMRTMVDQPYVNHVPTMIGGFGASDLHHFYRQHFIPNNPADMRSIPVSRTVGADRVVNETILCFTHDREIEWMLPGIAPTGRYVEIALIGIITFRGGKLAHEHIYWDQASVLVQIGLLDPAGLPVAGAEAARKVLDPSLPSNALLRNWSPPPGKPRP